MALPALEIRHLMASGQVWVSGGLSAEAPAAWGFAEIAGRLVELRGASPSATWTAAVSLVFDAQCLAEPVAWVTRPGATFFPPDVAANGADLAALAVVRVPGATAVLRAADSLLRSGAFGLVVLELGAECEFPMPAQVRLAGLAKRYDAVLCCLCSFPAGEERHQRIGGPDAGRGGRISLASLRAVSTRKRVGSGRFACTLEVVKDKRRGEPWKCAQVLRGPVGLR